MRTRAVFGSCSMHRDASFMPKISIYFMINRVRRPVSRVYIGEEKNTFFQNGRTTATIIRGLALCGQLETVPWSVALRGERTIECYYIDQIRQWFDGGCLIGLKESGSVRVVAASQKKNSTVQTWDVTWGGQPFGIVVFCARCLFSVLHAMMHTAYSSFDGKVQQQPSCDGGRMYVWVG